MINKRRGPFAPGDQVQLTDEKGRLVWISAARPGRTHDAKAAAYADRVYVVRDGRILEQIALGRRADHGAAPLIARLAQVGL